MLNQENNLYLISLSILIISLLDDEWILKGEATCQSLQGVKGLKQLCPTLNCIEENNTSLLTSFGGVQYILQEALCFSPDNLFAVLC